MPIETAYFSDRSKFSGFDDLYSAYEQLQKDSQTYRKDSMVLNSVLSSRFALSQQLGLGTGEVNTNPLNRNYYEQFGYPESISKMEYQRLYDRMPIASRVVRLFPSECWQTSPSIFDKDSPSESIFEKTLEILQRQFAFWGFLRRSDVLSGIGSYGIILFGLDDNKQLSEPVDGFDTGEVRPHQLLYLRTFPQCQVDISTFCQDRYSPRYGAPEMYRIQSAMWQTSGIEEQSTAAQTVNIHWSRILHVADNREVSEIFGVSRMQLVYNLLLDIEKVLGCSGEMFYKGTYPGYAIETVDGQLPTQFDTESIRQNMAEFQNGYQRWIGLQNAKITALSSMYTDPGGLLEQYIKMIAVALAVPQRILEGSERGELSSGQDAVMWAHRVQERRISYLIPYLVRPFINRLIRYGVIPQPFNKDYSVEWEGASFMSAEAKTQTNVAKLDLLQKYAEGKIGSLMSPISFMVTFLDMSEMEAKAFLQDASVYQAQQAAMTAAAGGATSDDDFGRFGEL